MSTQPDNLDLKLKDAHRFLEAAEYCIDLGSWRSGLELLTEAHAHLDWAREILATRAKRAGRKAK